MKKPDVIFDLTEHEDVPEETLIALANVHTQIDDIRFEKHPTDPNKIICSVSGKVRFNPAQQMVIKNLKVE